MRRREKLSKNNTKKGDFRLEELYLLSILLGFSAITTWFYIPEYSVRVIIIIFVGYSSIRIGVETLQQTIQKKR